MEGVENDFLIQVTNSLTRGESLPVLLLISGDEPIRDDKTGDSSDCSNPALVDFTVLNTSPVKKAEKVEVLQPGEGFRETLLLPLSLPEIWRKTFY